MKYQNSEFWNIKNPEILKAMEKVPRDRFVKPEDLCRAYDDHPLGIGHQQTISQPFIVAFMTDQLNVHPASRILEIGTGSGFQTAVLYQLCKSIYTIERIPQLAKEAVLRFNELGYGQIKTRIANARAGWPEEAPFDRIIVTAAPREIPEAFLRQLAGGGRMIIPVGPVHGAQYLLLLQKGKNGETVTKRLMAVSFVPLQ